MYQIESGLGSALKKIGSKSLNKVMHAYYQGKADHHTAQATHHFNKSSKDINNATKLAHHGAHYDMHHSLANHYGGMAAHHLNKMNGVPSKIQPTHTVPPKKPIQPENHAAPAPAPATKQRKPRGPNKPKMMQENKPTKSSPDNDTKNMSDEDRLAHHAKKIAFHKEKVNDHKQEMNKHIKSAAKNPNSAKAKNYLVTSNLHKAKMQQHMNLLNEHQAKYKELKQSLKPNKKSAASPPALPVKTNNKPSRPRKSKG